jgi:hypothetical protein
MPQMYNLCVQLSVDARTCASIFEVMHVCMLALLAREFSLGKRMHVCMLALLARLLHVSGYAYMRTCFRANKEDTCRASLRASISTSPPKNVGACIRLQ